MSQSIVSWERVAEVSARLYDQNIPTYYTIDHLEQCKNILATITGNKEYSYYISQLPLPEPIINDADDVVVFSEPLIAQLVNAPIEMPTQNVQIVEQFDLFREVKNVQAEELTRQNKSIITANIKKSTPDHFDLSRYVRSVQLRRLVLAAAHYNEHVTKHIPFDNHNGFDGFDFAVPRELLYSSSSSSSDISGKNINNTTTTTISYYNDY